MAPRFSFVNDMKYCKGDTSCKCGCLVCRDFFSLILGLKIATKVACPMDYMFQMDLQYWKNIKKKSCLIPLGLEALYNVCSIIE